MSVIQYKDGIFGIDLRFALNDPDAVKGKKVWEGIGETAGKALVEKEVDTREMMVQMKRMMMMMESFMSAITTHTDDLFDQQDESFMGVGLTFKKNIGGRTSYSQNEVYKAWENAQKSHGDKLKGLIRKACEKSRLKTLPGEEPWVAEWVNPLTGEMFEITIDDAVKQTFGRDGFTYEI